MRSIVRTTALMGVLALGSGLAFGTPLAEAQCGGGGGGYGGTPGYLAARGWGGHGGHHGGGHWGGACCGMGGMALGGMPGMRMGNYAGYAVYPQNAGYVQPAAPASYSCPMHPSVVSGTPGTCPICHMALVRR